MNREIVYHGSKFRNQKSLDPRNSGFGKNYVYATDNFVEAVIFLGERRNSLQATWNTDCDVPFFCERAEGVFDKWYSGTKGSVYVLSKREFKRDPKLSKHEYISTYPVKVLDEIEIPDAKDYLLSKLRIVNYKDRRTLFPDDNDLVRMCINGLDKYGVEYTVRKLRELQPDLEKEFLIELDKQKKMNEI